VWEGYDAALLLEHRETLVLIENLDGRGGRPRGSSWP
jgi:hypothetical protein